ncbi:MAG: dipeptidase [Paracoccus sp. (in: a-proteobacteria)]|nr:dipeptidase [Paracoccus sp. (in: a-proteobacteria)]
MVAVFDGHNDFLQRLLQGDAEQIWLEGDGTGHIDLPRLKAGGIFGGFFALWVPSEDQADRAAQKLMQENPPYDIKLDAQVPYTAAIAHAFRLTAALRRIEATGTLSVCTSVAEIEAAQQAGRIAAILHMEGAEPVSSLDDLALWHGMGLRSLGPVWSRPTDYGHGVPFAFPSSPDTGPGLTGRGRELIAECDRLRILVDLAHLNEAGMRDVAKISKAPLVSTHSGAHAVSQSSRNLTDAQLEMIAASGGVVGLNFASGFTREDGRREPFEGFDPYLRMLDHLLEKLGESGVAFGSDFDGALMPRDLPDAAALPRLIEAMRAHGYGEALVERIASRNWLDLLRRVWGA